MWTNKRRHVPPEARTLVERLRARGWKSDIERDELLRKLAAHAGLDPEDIAWMAAESDAAMRQTAISSLQKFSFEAATAAMFPFLAAHGDTARKNIFAAVEAVAGNAFSAHIPALLAHPDPSVVAIALDWLRRNPSEPWLAAVVPALGSHSPLVRRKAFGVIESVVSNRSFSLALQALNHDDEEIRYRAVLHVSKFPEEESIAPLLRRCHGDSARVQDAAIAAVAPLLSSSGTGGSGSDPRFNEYILPLLTDSNIRVRQLAIRILATQPPVQVADAFLKGFCNHYGPGRDRATEGLKSLGNEYIRAFLERDNDPNLSVAALASSIAVNLKTPEVVPHCIGYLTGNDWWLRDRAALMLADLRDERGLAPLLEMLKDPESDLSAAAALGAWGHPSALPGLLEAFKRGMTDLQLEILDAFAKFPDRRVPALLDQIARMVQDPLVQEKAERIKASLAGDVPFYESDERARAFEEIDFRANPSPTMLQMLAHARALGASDLHLGVGTRPHVRLIGRLQPLPLPETTDEQMLAWIPTLVGDRHEELETERQIDFCFKDRELGRFRSNVFFQRKGLNAVFRLVPFRIPTLTEINLPESLWEVTTFTQGLVLVTGPSGCGKTTTLAAIVDRINETERSHILTIEDPIEYVHVNKESLVNQREIPAHSKSFAKALRQSLREDPDVILVGEMRDIETISLAITASETGHLVLGTLHTTTASSTVDRIINAFPAEQQGQVRMMLADSLRAVVSQTLLPRRDGNGLIAAYEILRNTPNVAGLIREGKTFQLPTAMQTGGASGMMLMDSALTNMVNEKMVEPRDAYNRAIRKELFEPLLQADEAPSPA